MEGIPPGQRKQATFPLWEGAKVPGVQNLCHFHFQKNTCGAGKGQRENQGVAGG